MPVTATRCHGTNVTVSSNPLHPGASITTSYELRELGGKNSFDLEVRAYRGELVDEPKTGYFFSNFRMKDSLTINIFRNFCALVLGVHFGVNTTSKSALCT